jgi:hypothetical protein
VTYDASNRKDIRRAEKDAVAFDRQRQEAIANTMSTTQGRAYLWSEVSATHVFSTSFSLDPLQMAFLEGERNTGLRLIDLIMDSSPDEFILMWRENRARSSSTNERPGSQDGDGGDQGPDVD